MSPIDPRFGFSIAALALLAACGSQSSTQDSSEPEAPAENIEIVAAFPDSLNAFGDGYPASGNACRRLGESPATSNWLDASAVLVGCPTESSAKDLGGKIVGKVEGITLVSIPMGDENVGMEGAPPMTSPVKPAGAAKDMIRSKGGLEDKCKAAVARETGARVIGTNRIEESQAAIEIYVNVEGAEAPWRCLGYKNGSIGDVMYTGSEGGA